MNKIKTIILAASMVTLLTSAYTQPENLINVIAPSGLFNYNNTLYIGTYDEVSYKSDLNSTTTPKAIFNSHVFRTTYHEGNLYYSDSWNNIFKYDLNKGTNTVLFDDGSNIFGVTTFENDLYYTEWALGEIWKIDLNKPIVTPELIFLGLDTLGALLEKNGNLYITEPGTGSIFRLDLNSDYPRLDTIFHNKFQSPNELHIIGNQMYVSDYSANKISRFNIDDPNPISQDVILNIKSPAGLASDDKYLYISSFEEDEILRFPLNIMPAPDEVKTEDPIIIYPNPNFGTFSVSNLDKKEAYKIYDSKGRLVQSGIVGNNEEIQLNKELANTLFLKIRDSGLIRILALSK